MGNPVSDALSNQGNLTGGIENVLTGGGALGGEFIKTSLQATFGNNTPDLAPLPNAPVWQTSYQATPTTQTNFGSFATPSMADKPDGSHGAVLWVPPPPAPAAGQPGAGSLTGTVNTGGTAYSPNALPGGGGNPAGGSPAGSALAIGKIAGGNVGPTGVTEPGDPTFLNDQHNGMMANLKAQYGATANTALTASAMTAPTQTDFSMQKAADIIAKTDGGVATPARSSLFGPITSKQNTGFTQRGKGT